MEWSIEGGGVRTKFLHYAFFLRSFLIKCLLSPKPNLYDILQKVGENTFFGVRNEEIKIFNFHLTQKNNSID